MSSNCFCLKVLSHWLQAYGFSPVWVRRCITMWRSWSPHQGRHIKTQLYLWYYTSIQRFKINSTHSRVSVLPGDGSSYYICQLERHSVDLPQSVIGLAHWPILHPPTKGENVLFGLLKISIRLLSRVRVVWNLIICLKWRLFCQGQSGWS